jgi:transcriptional regulator with XRE-family HTH domain
MTPADLSFWRKTLSDAKADLKARGEINGESAIAATVSEELEGIGEGGVQRTTINHWLSGKRLPNIAQFIALCSALKVSPGDALDDRTSTTRHHLSISERAPAAYLDADTIELSRFIERLQRTEPKARKIAMAAAEAVIDTHGPEAGQRKSKRR